jgi:hypothetical protein
MTPKFDNLAKLLMEMPGKNRIPDEKRLEIAEYIEKFPEDNYDEIADAFGVHRQTVNNIAMELKVRRGRGRRNLPGHRASSENLTKARAALQALKGTEKHPQRRLTDAQEKQILDYWMANHHDVTYGELARWTSQQFNVPLMVARHMVDVLSRAAAKQVPPVRLPPPDKGKGRRLQKQRDDKKRHATDLTGIPTQKPQQFRGSTDIVPSNPDHGGPAHSPTPPMDQDKRL